MVNVDRLTAALKACSIPIEKAADALGIDRATFYRRLQKQGTKFTVEEVAKLAEMLNLSSAELQEIFFDQQLA